MSLFQNKRTGQNVELISYHDKDYAMVKNQAGVISYVALDDLVVYEVGKGRTTEKPVSLVKADDPDPEVPPTPAIPPDTRLNLNLASAETIADRIKGIGYTTAKRIVELRLGLPGERFVTLDQVRSVKRVDWDEVMAEDVIYVA
jgi:DNA uptake protein ComE-like DNA-binding protein